VLPTVSMDECRGYECCGIIDILDVGINDAIKCCFVFTICFLFGCFPGMCESLGVRHWSDHLSLNETVEFISSGEEPGAPGSGGDKGGRHRGIDEGVIGEGLEVVGCRTKGMVVVNLTISSFLRPTLKAMSSVARMCTVRGCGNQGDSSPCLVSSLVSQLAHCRLLVKESCPVSLSSPVSQLSRSQLSSESPSFSPAMGIPLNWNSSSSSLSSCVRACVIWLSVSV
jgi:hypothetical protein